jgi:hypothetical protein
MPLRKFFRENKSDTAERLNIRSAFTYRATDEVREHETEAFHFPMSCHLNYLSHIANCTHAVVPPSTVAYEAMALDLQVELHGGVEGYEHIAQGMFKARAALYWKPERAGYGAANRTHRGQIDARGAIRLLEALL